MSRTPICDRWEYESHSSGLVVPLNVAQEIESGLADKDQQLAEARAEIERLKKNLRLLLCKKHLDACENSLFNSRFPDDEPCLICVVEAAERGE